MGGTESDIRTLHYWSRVAFLFLVAGGVVWAAIGVLDLHRGLTWYELDDVTGSTQSISDLSWGVVCVVLAALSFFVAGRLNRDIVSVFGERRFQVPRERLMVYGMLGFPFGLVGAGVLLVLVNVKLSHPEFLPSHADAYPEAMPVVYMPPPTEPAPAPAPVPGGPAPAVVDGMVELPAVQGPVVAPPQPTPGVPGPAVAPPPAPAEEGPVVMAMVEEVPTGAPAPSPEAEVPAVVEAPPAEAVYEEVPMPVAVGEVAEAPPEEAVEAFEEVPMAEAPVAPVEQAPPPRDIKSAHEDLMKKLLRK